MLIPIQKLNERVEIAKQDSDTGLFMSLMYSGEQLLKLITSAMISGIDDEKASSENNQYSHNYKLVHADSIGIWSQVLENILTGPSYHFLREEFKLFWDELSIKATNPSWQYGALVAINNSLKAIKENHEDLPTKYQLKNWFSLFVRLRNDARAHGIPSADAISKICPNLEKSIKLISENLSLFKVPWIFIKQNVSGSYRFASLTQFSNNDEIQSEINKLTLSDGIYIFIKKPFSIDVIKSNIEAFDFYFPNGNFNDKSYECISYISGNKVYRNSKTFLTPPGQLPNSETEGLGKLDIIHSTFTNLPHLQSIYINRKELEDELEKVLLFEDIYPIITLSGRGGIGKTSLALFLLQKICNTERFDVIIWLSARDIDLFEEGPKTVKPQILDENDIATEFVKLIEPPDFQNKEFNRKGFIETELKSAATNTNGKILFVMDNFETLKNPKQVYEWLVTHVRNPNKILITSRLRDFKADYPINVTGMNREEFNALVERVSLQLSIHQLLNKSFLDELYKESDGHPYVIKVMLGEVSKEKELKNVKRIISGKDEILTALFERTYSNLSVSAKRVFLTLCSWRNIFPEIAIESVLNREENELINVENSIEELNRYSFIELLKSDMDESVFISVPLTAFEFGKKKLSVSPLKSAIQLDISLLNYFGVTQFTDINKGLKPRVEYFFKTIAITIRQNTENLNKYLPILEFVCRKYPYGWIMLHRIYYDTGINSKAIEVLQNYVADHRVENYEKIYAWELLAKFYSLEEDFNGEAQALVDICEIDNIDFNILSNSMHSLINLFKGKKLKFKKDEIFILLNNVVQKMQLRIDNGEGVIGDFTKLAWGYIHLEKKERAKKLVIKALKKDRTYFPAQNLAKILNIKPADYFS